MSVGRQILPLQIVSTLVLTLLVPTTQTVGGVYGFVVEETTIASVHEGFSRGAISCRQLVETYLARIEAYDDKGPTLNAIASINPAALGEADRLDEAFARRGLTGPLHCVPVLVKDNLETAGWATTAGTSALRDNVPARDATVLTRLKEAGAIILAKTNLSELAVSAMTTNSRLFGVTQNPYALDRVPAGSSGGTSVGVAANFGLVGLGTDTGNSIRGPAAHASLVGLRPTYGLVSRSGMIPLDLLSDTVGPLARTVEDAAAVLAVIAGVDPDDPSTTQSPQSADSSWRRQPNPTPLAGVRLGLLSQAFQGGPLKIDPLVARVFARALTDLSILGADIQTDVALPYVPPSELGERCRGLEFDLDLYLEARNGRAPIHRFSDLLRHPDLDPSVEADIRALTAKREAPPDSEECRANLQYRQQIRAAIETSLDGGRLDAFIYPTWSQPPQLRDKVDLRTSGQTLRFATASGLPAMTVPMGFTQEVLPAGLSLLGRAWSEQTLLRIAHDYEQATRHRRPPVVTPPIRCKCPI